MNYKIIIILFSIIISSIFGILLLNKNNHNISYSNPKILTFGDSLTYGTGSTNGLNYPYFLSKKTGFEVISDAIPGATAIGSLDRFKNSISKHKPDIVIILIGGNDFLRQNNLKMTEASISDMVEFSLNNNVEVFLISVPNGVFQKKHPMYDRIAKYFNVKTDNGILYSLLMNPSLKSDPIHLNNQGYEQLAEKIIESFNLN